MNEQDRSYEEARKRVQELRSFYRNLITYLIINTVLVIINLVTNPDHLWFYWVTVFWGIGLLMQAMTVFLGKGRLLGREWEEKQIKKIMDRQNSSTEDNPE
ncbi:MAG: histidine kinase [Candidatus Aegiribacteria sp.]|nr:histidine kinase [Candidatus Aegiribacteria sp.]